jgi:hypothetical protein
MVVMDCLLHLLSESAPSNIKIQKTGAEEVGNTQVRLPASDLERYA